MKPTGLPITRVTIEYRPPALGNIDPSSPMHSATLNARKQPIR